MEKPSEKLFPNLQEDEQDMEMKPVVLGPPAYGSPDPATSGGGLVAIEDHPLEIPEDYGAEAVAAGAVKGAGADSGDGKPAKSATRDEWDAYAQSMGVDPDDYSSKDDLIEALS
jgi:hypothetical protein